jgi:hypothetical protein
MALRCARIGARAGEPGVIRARLTSRSRRVRSSSPTVSWLTSCLRLDTAKPGPVFRLGYHLGQLISQASQDRGLCLLEERDGGLELASVGGELVSGQLGQRVLGLVDRWRLFRGGRHRGLVLRDHGCDGTGAGADKTMLRGSPGSHVTSGSNRFRPCGAAADVPGGALPVPVPPALL